MRQAHHNLPHWNYYRLLERDLEECFRYVHPALEHYGVYSDEFARVILMASTEIENALNSFAFWPPSCTPRPRKIVEHYSCVTTVFPRFCDMELVMPRYSLGFTPWDGWSANSAPDWWSFGYNKIKHDRLNHPDAPTMIRAIKAVGSLLVVLLHFYRKRFGRQVIMPAEIMPSLMIPWDKNDNSLGAMIGWSWELPDEVSSGSPSGQP